MKGEGGRGNHHSCHREGAARGDPLALGKRTALSVRALRDTMDCRVPRLRSLLAMTGCVVHKGAESLPALFLLPLREVLDVVEDPPVNPAD